MKNLLLLNCLLFVCFATMLPVGAQTPTPAGNNPFLDEAQGNMQGLHNAIIKQPYTFEVGGWKMHLTFHSDGLGEEEDWKFRWRAKDAHTVELSKLGKDGKPDGKKTTLTFSDDYSTYTGYHFDGTTAVKGSKVEKHK